MILLLTILQISYDIAVPILHSVVTNSIDIAYDSLCNAAVRFHMILPYRFFFSITTNSI